MKVIDLLNKIANGEALPKKFKDNYHTYTKIEQAQTLEDDSIVIDINYQDELGGYLFGDNYALSTILNDEVEIIEEEQDIEEIPYHYNLGYIDCGNLKREVVEELSKNFNYFADKINELIKK